jgi:glycosyltransferase involved in cell wall biosynthesis
VRIAILNWRDLTHPDGGGAERYAVNVATGLVRRGHEVTLLCADHGGAPRDEIVDGVRLRRRGGRLGVYQQGLRGLHRLERTEGPFDVVVDVQNGLPFFSPLATRTPVVSLVHHVHREQWPVVFGPVAARIGWGIESRLSPRVYRGRQYVAVSGRTKDELAELGVDPSHIAVVHNGTDPPMSTDVARSAIPTIVILAASCRTSESSTPSMWWPGSPSHTPMFAYVSSATAGGLPQFARTPRRAGFPTE